MTTVALLQLNENEFGPLLGEPGGDDHTPICFWLCCHRCGRWCYTPVVTRDGPPIPIESSYSLRSSLKVTFASSSAEPDEEDVGSSRPTRTCKLKPKTPSTPEQEFVSNSINHPIITTRCFLPDPATFRCQWQYCILGIDVEPMVSFLRLYGESIVPDTVDDQGWLGSHDVAPELFRHVREILDACRQEGTGSSGTSAAHPLGSGNRRPGGTSQTSSGTGGAENEFDQFCRRHVEDQGECIRVEKRKRNEKPVVEKRKPATHAGTGLEAPPLVALANNPCTVSYCHYWVQCELCGKLRRCPRPFPGLSGFVCALAPLSSERKCTKPQVIQTADTLQAVKAWYKIHCAEVSKRYTDTTRIFDEARRRASQKRNLSTRLIEDHCYPSNEFEVNSTREQVGEHSRGGATNASGQKLYKERGTRSSAAGETSKSRKPKHDAAVSSSNAPAPQSKPKLPQPSPHEVVVISSQSTPGSSTTAHTTPTPPTLDQNSTVPSSNSPSNLLSSGVVASSSSMPKHRLVNPFPDAIEIFPMPSFQGREKYRAQGLYQDADCWKWVQCEAEITSSSSSEKPQRGKRKRCGKWRLVVVKNPFGITHPTCDLCEDTNCEDPSEFVVYGAGTIDQKVPGAVDIILGMDPNIVLKHHQNRMKNKGGNKKEEEKQK